MVSLPFTAPFRGRQTGGDIMTSHERAKARRAAKARIAKSGGYPDMAQTRDRLGYAPQPTRNPITGREAQRKLRFVAK